jgi:hypothetical protein
VTVDEHRCRCERPGAHDYSRPGKPEIAWDDPAARDELVTTLVNDVLAVLAELEERHPGGAGLDEKAAQAVALLALVAGQDVEPAWAPMDRRPLAHLPTRSPRTA